MFDPVNRILGRVTKDKYSHNKDMPITEVVGYSQKELQRDYANKWRIEHPEEDKEKKRTYYQKNLERERAKRRIYGREHSAEAVARVKKWEREHREKHLENMRRRNARYRAKYPEKVAELRRRYREKSKVNKIKKMIDYV